MAITRANGYVDYSQTAGTSNYIPQLYAKKVLYDFYANSVYQEITNTDFEGQIKSFGDKVIIRKAPSITVGDYTVGGTVTYQEPDEASTELVIDKAKYQAFRIDDVDRLQVDVGLMDMFSSDAANRMRIAIDTDVLAVMGAGAIAANKGATAGAISGNIDLGATGAGIGITSSNAVDYMVYMGQVLDEQNIPQENRFVVIPSWYAALLRLSDLKSAYITGDSSGVIRNGMIGMVNNFKVFVNNNLTHTTDGSDEAFSVVAGTKAATSFAAQITKTDTIKIPDSFGEYWRTLFVYGRKVVQPEAITNLYCFKG